MKTEVTLRKLQLTQLEILKKIDEVCKENEIQYSLYAGTLLGAVRHQGFIPWDDDLDICMSRENYKRFIKVWNMIEPEGYILQNKENSREFSQSFTKIRKYHTTFLQYENEIGKYHTGIFVDIFPIDRIPNKKYQEIFFKFNCMMYQLYTREFVPPKSGTVVKVLSAFLLKVIGKNKRMAVREKLLNKIIKYNSNQQLDTVGIETLASLNKRFPADMLDLYITLKFEDDEFMCFANWDEHLKCKFGDYWTLPPESEREWKHHPIILDFAHNYEELNKYER